MRPKSLYLNDHLFIFDTPHKDLASNDNQYDSVHMQQKVKLKNAIHTPDSKSNAANTSPNTGLSTSFNHTDAIAQFAATSKHGFTYNISMKQTVSGSDSTAIPLNLNGITSGSIIKLTF